MKKEELLKILKENKGITIKNLCSKYNLNYKAVSKMIRTYNYTSYITKTDWITKSPSISLNKIDSPEKAYCIGFIGGDGHIDNKNKVSISLGIKDKCILEFIKETIGGEVSIDLRYIKKHRKFPKASLSKVILDIKKFYGGRLKKDRSLPHVSKNLEKYLVLGFFDAEGCLTWGYRKDRNRIWQKISFTSQYDLLISIQKILTKINISTSIRPKQNEDCYVLEFSSRNDVIRFCDWLYSDLQFIVLKRKLDNYNALRLELGEFGETTNSTIPSQATDHSVEGVETTGGKMGSLNNQQELPRQLKLF